MRASKLTHNYTLGMETSFGFVLWNPSVFCRCFFHPYSFSCALFVTLLHFLSFLFKSKWYVVWDDAWIHAIVVVVAATTAAPAVLNHRFIQCNRMSVFAER